MKKILPLILSIFIFITIGTTNVLAETKTGTLNSGMAFSYDTVTKTLTLSGGSVIGNYNTSNNYYGMSDDLYVSSNQEIKYPYQNVEHVIISEGITLIGECAFRNWTGLKTVTLPSSMKVIDFYAFGGCSNLSGINFNNGLTTIESMAFFNCLKLGIIELPNSLTKVDKFAFDKASTVAKYKGSLSFPGGIGALAITSEDVGFDENGCLVINDELVLYNGDFRNIKITEGIKSIGARAFGMAPSNKIQNAIVSIPSSVKTIKSEAFASYAEPIKINYGGSISEWDAIQISSLNTAIKKSNVVFNMTKLSSDSSVMEGEDIMVTITPVDAFNASYIKLNFDSTKVSFVSATSGFGTKVEGGSLILSCYGLEGISQIVAKFKANTPGSAEFSIAEAKFGTKIDAEDKDLLASNVEGSSCSTTIRNAQHSVTFSSEGLFSGSNQVSDGTTYEFEATDDTHYTYSNVTATMNSESVTVNYDSTSKKYSIANVIGDLVINGTRTGNTYAIIYNTTTSATHPEAPESAKYGDTVNVTIPSEENWAYNVTSVSGQLGDYSVDNGILSFTMGADVTVTIDKYTRDQSVKVEGNGISDVAAASSYTQGTDFSFKVTKDSAYTYTVSAKVNNTSVELVHEGESDEYTITAPAYGGIVITVNKSVVNGNITADEFVKFDGKIVYLIENKIQKLDDNRYFTYDGKDMFWSDTYGSYCYLVISSTTPNINESLFDLKSGTVKEISYVGDVNETGNVDSNDAQLVWNMYKPLYSDFTEKVTMEKFLKADVNGDKKITIADAAKILDLAYGINSSSAN